MNSPQEGFTDCEFCSGTGRINAKLQDGSILVNAPCPDCGIRRTSKQEE